MRPIVVVRDVARLQQAKDKYRGLECKVVYRVDPGLYATLERERCEYLATHPWYCEWHPKTTYYGFIHQGETGWEPSPQEEAV